MKAIFSFLIFFLFLFYANAQTKRIELSELFKSLIPDSSEYQITGDWNMKKPDAQTIRWTSDHLEMSDDMTINFFKNALVQVTLKGRNRNPGNSKWNLMLRGPRMGFDNFNLTSPYLSGYSAPPILDSLLSSNSYKSTLVKSCKPTADKGYNWYKIILPKKITAFIKLAWEKNNDQYRLIIDCYDSWSMKYARLDCK
ncbi:MAG: hypothetical protein ABI784_09355 [Ginsengibacter sp.]